MATKNAKKNVTKKEEAKAASVAPVKEAAKAEAPKAAPVAPVKEAVKAPAAPVKEAAPAKEAAKKPAAKKSAAKKPAAKKAAEKKSAAKTPAKKPAAKKAKEITMEDICAKLSKRIDAAKAAKLADTIAVDVQVWGWEDGTQRHLYIEVKDGKATVAPYDYQGPNFNAYINVADAVALADGKLTVIDALLGGKLNAIGVIGDAVKLASIF